MRTSCSSISVLLTLYVRLPEIVTRVVDAGAGRPSAIVCLGCASVRSALLLWGSWQPTASALLPYLRLAQYPGGRRESLVDDRIRKPPEPAPLVVPDSDVRISRPPIRSVSDAFYRSIVLVLKAPSDGRIAVGVADARGTGLCGCRRMDEDQWSSSEGSDATMRRASSMLNPRTEPS